MHRMRGAHQAAAAECGFTADKRRSGGQRGHQPGTAATALARWPRLAQHTAGCTPWLVGGGYVFGVPCSRPRAQHGYIPVWPAGPSPSRVPASLQAALPSEDHPLRDWRQCGRLKRHVAQLMIAQDSDVSHAGPTTGTRISPGRRNAPGLWFDVVWCVMRVSAKIALPAKCVTIALLHFGKALLPN